MVVTWWIVRQVVVGGRREEGLRSEKVSSHISMSRSGPHMLKV